MEQDPPKTRIVPASPQTKRAVKWVVIVFFVALAAIIVSNLPRGYSDDLSRIGKGKPALVLVRDKESVPSFNQLELMNGLRGRYEAKVEFLLTDYDTPAGQAFMQTNKAERGALALFDSNGDLVKILPPPQTAAGLQQELAAALPGENR